MRPSPRGGRDLEAVAEADLGVDVAVIPTPPLYILYGEAPRKCTGWCQNDVNVCDEADRDARGHPRVAQRQRPGPLHGEPLDAEVPATEKSQLA